MTDDLIEAVARAIEKQHYGWERGNSEQWKQEAEAAIRAAAPMILDMVCAHIQENYAFDKRQLVPDIRQLKERFQ